MSNINFTKKSVLDYLEDDVSITKRFNFVNSEDSEWYVKQLDKKELLFNQNFFDVNNKNIKSLNIIINNRTKNFDNLYCKLEIGGSYIYGLKFVNNMNIIPPDILILCPRLTKMEFSIRFHTVGDYKLSDIIDNSTEFTFLLSCVKIKKSIPAEILSRPWFVLCNKNNKFNIFIYNDDGMAGCLLLSELDDTEYLSKTDFLDKFIKNYQKL